MDRVRDEMDLGKLYEAIPRENKDGSFREWEVFGPTNSDDLDNEPTGRGPTLDAAIIAINLLAGTAITVEEVTVYDHDPRWMPTGALWAKALGISN